ncbi:MAG: methyltransferase domain-containing protein [Hyphomonadaceae bacterium]|nr:methyltransferase domain-containing protein [Hyphomonadaceae bacterium]GIK47441.1 MAG: hypothetical protein BroJett013_01380 [Alphaproteobacteria bacterium]
MQTLQDKLHALGEWYHRIDLGGGIITPGDRNQSLTYALYERFLPRDLTGLTVLDLGANACGLSIEFAKRGASVTAIERADAAIAQARFVLDHFGLADRVTIHNADAHEMTRFGQFDIVACVGLVYHLRHPQLALDQLGHVTKSHLLVSTQTTPGDALTLTSRGAKRSGFSATWEPTEPAFEGMLVSAGFRNVELVSTKPHAGESPGNILGNRSYFYAKPFKRVELPHLY